MIKLKLVDIPTIERGITQHMFELLICVQFHVIGILSLLKHLNVSMFITAVKDNNLGISVNIHVQQLFAKTRA